MHKFIERKLWHDTQHNRVELPQIDLLKFTNPLIILGEAGMGKSFLLEWLATHLGYALCTARQLINRPDPRTLQLLGEAKILVIDAIDEVSSRNEGDAVGEVLKKLGALNYPGFVLSCRVSDWRSATGLEAIREQYPEKPIELHLVPFDEKDAAGYLSSTLGYEKANNIVKHFIDRGLKGFLNSPQTLNFISDIAASGSLPETHSELFEKAIEILRIEHRDSKAYDLPAREIALDAAGAAFAGIILTGSEAIVRKSPSNSIEGELQLADITILPCGEAINSILGTRLFKGDGADRFSYVHRRVGEYLGARWLAKHANNKRMRKRLLSLFHSHGLVPASLRGIHAWLARDPALAKDVIEADPMGIVEYGDADDLTIEQARILIRALEKLALENPRFRGWATYSLRGIAHPSLIDDLRRLITSPNTPYGLTVLVLEAIKGTATTIVLAEDLRSKLLDKKAIFAIRRAAGEALTELQNKDDWPSILRILCSYNDEDSIRLAIELVDDLGYEPFDDNFIIELVVSYAINTKRTVGVLTSLERHLPESRIEGVLDQLIVEAKKLGVPYKRPSDDVITDFAYHLIMRNIAAGDVTAEKLWSWLEPFDVNVGHDRETRQQLEAILQKNDHLRHGIQRLVLLELPDKKNIWERDWRKNKRSSALALTAEDIVALLEGLDPEDHQDERWRDLIQLIHHDKTEGAEVRLAARCFAAHRSDLLTWLVSLALPRVPDWKIRETERERKRKAKQATRFAEDRKYFTAHIDEMRAGEFRFIINPATAYLKLFLDIGDDVPAHRRIFQWLGDDIADAAHEGFEAYLQHNPPMPSAHEISEALAESKAYDAGRIIVSALAERLRNDIGFDDLTDERLMAGLFELRDGSKEDHAEITGLREAVETVIKTRGVWEDAMRLYYEPQLKAYCKHVRGLYTFLHDDADADAELATKLAAEWLKLFPDLPTGPESELIDHLLQAGCFDELRNITVNRVGICDNERQRNWDTVGLIVDFQKTAERLSVDAIAPELIWHIRNRTSDSFNNNIFVLLNISQLEWIISNFRSSWPVVRRPNTVTHGDTNPWDASEYIFHLIQRIGNDPSKDAVDALKRLRNAPADGYLEPIKAIIAEQTRTRVESNYVSPSLAVINAIVRNITPESAADLQTFMLAELAIVQEKIKSDDAESWRGFFDDKGVPFDEERCRDHLLGLLRQGSKEVQFDLETHVSADKEVDIACSTGQLRMPIEVKGQWHRDLWHAADNQLDTFYTPDWRAEGRGIYLVLWFGDQQQSNKRLKGLGRGVKLPKTANELQEMIITRSKSARDGRVKIMVLDLLRLFSQDAGN